MVMQSVIQLAHDNAEAICMKAAKLIHGKIKTYAEVPVHELAPRLRSTLEKQLEYLQHHDPEAWRRNAAHIVESRLQQGISAGDLIQAGQVMLQVLGEFFESELGKRQTIGGEEASKVAKQVKARIAGMSAVATAVAANAGARQANEALALVASRKGPTGQKP